VPTVDLGAASAAEVGMILDHPRNPVSFSRENCGRRPAWIGFCLVGEMHLSKPPRAVEKFKQHVIAILPAGACHYRKTGEDMTRWQLAEELVAEARIIHVEPRFEVSHADSIAL